MPNKLDLVFMQSPFFKNIDGTWYLKPGAPPEIVGDFARCIEEEERLYALLCGDSDLPVTRSDRSAVPTDGSKRWTWPFEPYKSPDFMANLEANGFSLDEFRNTTLYRRAQDAQVVLGDEWIGVPRHQKLDRLVEIFLEYRAAQKEFPTELGEFLLTLIERAIYHTVAEQLGKSGIAEANETARDVATEILKVSGYLDKYDPNASKSGTVRAYLVGIARNMTRDKVHKELYVGKNPNRPRAQISGEVAEEWNDAQRKSLESTGSQTEAGEDELHEFRNRFREQPWLLGPPVDESFRHTSWWRSYWAALAEHLAEVSVGRLTEPQWLSMLLVYGCPGRNGLERSGELDVPTARILKKALPASWLEAWFGHFDEEARSGKTKQELVDGFLKTTVFRLRDAGYFDGAEWGTWGASGGAARLHSSLLRLATNSNVLYSLVPSESERVMLYVLGTGGVTQAVAAIVRRVSQQTVSQHIAYGFWNLLPVLQEIQRVFRRRALTAVLMAGERAAAVGTYDQSILEESYGKGYSDAQIAVSLGITRQAVGARRRRAEKAYVEKLKEIWRA